MPAPQNRLKTALAEGRMQIGLWLGLAHAGVAEAAARAGYDWCLIDGEHGPNSVPTILAQLHAMGNGSASPVVRVPIGQDWLLKQVLDLGAQSVLVPMVDTAQQAAAMADAVRYPPQGTRGLGASVIRASGFNEITDYATTANDQICLIVQAESQTALDNIDAIAATEGVDAVFIGPSDLSASMGFTGRPDAPEVTEAIAGAIARIRAAGKAAGILTKGAENFALYHKLGVTFMGLGADVTILAGGMRDLAARTRADLGLPEVE